MEDSSSSDSSGTSFSSHTFTSSISQNTDQKLEYAKIKEERVKLDKEASNQILNQKKKSQNQMM